MQKLKYVLVMGASYKMVDIADVLFQIKPYKTRKITSPKYIRHFR